MDRNQAKEFYPILQAYAEGRVIECRTKPSFIEGTDVPNDWTEMKEIEFWNNTEYRIKPEPTYRPFKDAKECRAEMLKHQPFGWIKSNVFEYVGAIRSVSFELNNLCVSDSYVTFKEGFDNYTFIDGTPFGTNVEE